MAELNHRLFEQQYFYPFEVYQLRTTFVAFNTATNTSLPIVSLAFSDSVNNFQPQVNESDTQTNVNNTLVNSRATHLTIKRTTSAKVFVIFILVSNWSLTAAIVYITYLAMRSKTRLGDGIVLLPVTIILTLPQLRQFFFDAPPIGEFTSYFFYLITTTDTGYMYAARYLNRYVISPSGLII